MQIVSNGDNLHKMSNPVFWVNIIILLSAKLAQTVVMVKCYIVQREKSTNDSFRALNKQSI